MPKSWNQTLQTLQGATLLQSQEWGELKSAYGWKPYYRTWPVGETPQPDAAAMMLLRRIPMGGLSARLAIAYVPRGPVLDWRDHGLRRRVFQDLKADARRRGAIFLKIDPQVLLGTGVPGESGSETFTAGKNLVADMQAGGWQFSKDQVQYRNTVLVDLEKTEDDLLAAMKQKTRYNIRLAGRKGVRVRTARGQDFEMLYDMYASTALRDGFVLRTRQYYLDMWRSFDRAGMLDPLIAEVDGEPVAGVVIFRFAGTAIYMHGMSSGAERKKMPNYLLQWEAMRRAKAAGCRQYDMWGAPNEFSENDPMWGVFRFKDGFGGTVARHIGAWDLPIRPLAYRLYTQVMPRVLDYWRRRNK